MINKHPLGKCEACPLKEHKYVASQGPTKASIVIVGEAPGQKEVTNGIPFSGPSGKLLDTVLDSYGIDRAEAFVTNVVLCRPTANDTPSKEAIACCAERLQSEITEREPKHIIALGNTAAAAIGGKKVKITAHRVGPPKQSKLYPGAKVISTFHPAACLRNADSFPYLVKDIGKVNGTISIGWEPPTYVIYDDVAKASGALSEVLRRGKGVTIDIETAYDKDASFEHANHTKLLCIGVGYDRGKVVVIGEYALQNREVQRLFGNVLELPITAHNGKFDLAALRRWNSTAKLSYDTMLASYADDERPGTHGLKYLAVELLGAPRYDDEIKALQQTGKMSFADLPRPALYQYNAYDVHCTMELQHHYEQTLSPDLKRLHNYLVNCSNALMPVEMQGIAVDVPYLDELEERMTRELLEAEESLAAWVRNPRSPKQVKKVLEEMNLPVDSTDKETLVRLVTHELGLDEQDGNDLDQLLLTLAVIAHNSKSEFLWRMLKYRREQKLYGTYVKGLRKRLYRNRVFPTFLLHGTVTGRLSCRNPNLQNIPRGSSIRNLFVPTEGNVFVQADYSQAELRTIAALAKEPWLRTVFSENRDIHGEVAKRYFGENWTKEQRVKAKMVVFGLSYNMSSQGLARRMKIPLVEAQAYRQGFFDTIPQVVKWQKDTQRRVLTEQSDLVTPYDRHRRFWLITKENREDIIKEALAFMPQSIASDICLSAGNRLASEYGMGVRLLVHDSILVECPIDQAQDVARTMEKVMEESALTFTDYVPYKVDIATGDSWGAL